MKHSLPLVGLLALTPTAPWMLQDCGGPDEPPPSPLIISEYLEGAGWDKALEIWNTSDAAVSLAGVEVWKLSNGGEFPGEALVLQGELGAGEGLVITHPSASQALRDRADLVTAWADWNGNDALGLAVGGALTDLVGEAGNAPASGWSVAGTSLATVDHRLLRKGEVTQGSTDWMASAGQGVEDSQWIVASPGVDTLGVHPHAGPTEACTATNQCAPGLQCIGVPNPYYGYEGTGCCTSTAPVPGQGQPCAPDGSCGDGLVCILDACSPEWMAGTYDSRPNAAIPDDATPLQDVMVVGCLATVPVDASMDLHIDHPRPADLKVTVIDPGQNWETVIWDGGSSSGAGLHLTGVPVNHTGDDSVNGPWILTVTDRQTGQVGVLTHWTLYLTSRWD